MIPPLRSNIRWLLIFLVSIGELAGCASIETPDEVARNFWSAMKGKDEMAARRYTTENTRMLIELSDFRWPGAEVTFNEIRIKGEGATIDTEIGQTENKITPIAAFQTILKRENGSWKVDYKETMMTISNNHGFSKLIQGIRTFKQQLSENLDDALSNLKKEAPKLEREFESLGDTVRKSVDEFARKLNKILKDSQNTRRNRTEKDNSI